MMFQRFVTRFQSVGFCLAGSGFVSCKPNFNGTNPRPHTRTGDGRQRCSHRRSQSHARECRQEKVQRVLETNGSGDYVAPGLEPRFIFGYGRSTQF